MPQHNTSSFGRGWIPIERDIGLPHDSNPFVPLPSAGGPEGDDYAGGYAENAAYASAHPKPSRLQEGLCLALPFTLERRLRFLHLLAGTGNVRRACQAVGVSPQSAYVHKRRDAAFAAGWDAALILARDAAEEVLAERALRGTQETIFYRGEAVGSRVRFDARLLLAHLARLDRHHEQAEGAAIIAARFDDYLAELHTGEPRFEAPFHDREAPPEWSPAHPTRDEVRLTARERALHAFPQRFEDLPAETRAELETSGLHKYDRWHHACAQSQSRAEQAAAAAWDEAAQTRLAALDALFEAEGGPEVLEPHPSTPAQAGASVGKAQHLPEAPAFAGERDHTPGAPAQAGASVGRAQHLPEAPVFAGERDHTPSAPAQAGASVGEAQHLPEAPAFAGERDHTPRAPAQAGASVGRAQHLPKAPKVAGAPRIETKSLSTVSTVSTWARRRPPVRPLSARGAAII